MDHKTRRLKISDISTELHTNISAIANYYGRGENVSNIYRSLIRSIIKMYPESVKDKPLDTIEKRDVQLKNLTEIEVQQLKNIATYYNTNTNLFIKQKLKEITDLYPEHILKAAPED